MSAIPAYPLNWPTGWKRTPLAQRTTSRFGKASRARAGGGRDNGRPLTIRAHGILLKDWDGRPDLDNSSLDLTELEATPT